MGPAKVGSVQSISLTANGQAQVTMSIDSGAAPLHEGTVARIYENSLSGIANKYVVLEPAATEAPAIPDGGTIAADHTYSFVSLDQVFDALDPLTRAGLRNVIKGEAASIQGRSAQASKTLEYLAPGLAQHEQPDRRARPQRAGVRRAAGPGRAGDAGAGLAGAAAERPDRAGEHDDRRGGAPERRARAGPPAPAGHAQPRRRARSPGSNSTLDALDPLVAKSKTASQAAPAVRRRA